MRLSMRDDVAGESNVEEMCARLLMLLKRILLEALVGEQES